MKSLGFRMDHQAIAKNAIYCLCQGTSINTGNLNGKRRFDFAAALTVFLVFMSSIYLTKDFISTILVSIVMVYLLRPIYAGIFRLTGRGRLSSFASLLVIFMIILVVFLGLAGVLLAEISNLQRSGALADVKLSSISKDFNIWLEESLPNPVVIYIKSIGDIPAAIAYWATPIAQAQLSAFFSGLPILSAKAIVAIFFTYYMLIDGKRIADQFEELLPKSRRGIVRRFRQELDSIYTTLFTVYFTTAIVAGSLASLGFYLLGLPYPLVWGMLAAIMALIPIPGPIGVYVPISLYHFLVKDYQMGIITLVFGVVFLTLIPFNLVAPQLALKTARIHPILTLLAYVGPIFVVGILGVIIGPLMIGFLLAAYRTANYYREI